MAALLALVAPVWTTAEVSVGGSTGINTSGDQDQKFKQYDSQGMLVDDQFTDQIGESINLLSGMDLSVWGNRGALRKLGLQLEALFWATNTSASGLSSTNAPPFSSTHQERLAILCSMVYRTPFGDSTADSPMRQGPYLFWGMGVGEVRTKLDTGQSEWKIGYQLLGGISFPVRGHLRLRVEGKYLLTADVDAVPDHGWQVDTSGTPTFFRLGPHQDTRFLGLLVGLDLQFR